MDQSDAGSMGIFSRWTNHTQEAWVYSHDGPIRAPMLEGCCVRGLACARRPGLLEDQATPR
eukprot:9490044-Pyramimonas_sp.AAC.1